MNSLSFVRHSFLLRLILLFLLLLLGGKMALSGHLLFIIIGIFVIGAMFAHGIELQHQCLHGTAFKSKTANEIVGIVLGIPALISFYSYRRAHLEHHRKLGTPSDIAFFSYRSSRSLTWRSVLIDAFGFDHFAKAVTLIAGSFSLNRSSRTKQNTAIWNYQLIGAIILIAITWSFFFHTDILVRIWFIPLVLATQPIHFLIELPEHLFCETNSYDTYRNTRTIFGSAFSRWFTNYNNFHVEHHLYPGIPMSHLADLGKSGPIPYSHVHKTYPAFFGEVFTKLIANKGDDRSPEILGSPA